MKRGQSIGTMKDGRMSSHLESGSQAVLKGIVVLLCWSLSTLSLKHREREEEIC